jgi:hypothetical protein
MDRIETARALGHKNLKHGQARPESRGPTYRSWECMKSRCNNENDPSFKHYGARGIKVYPLWDKDFVAFLSYMGERPRGFSLDRIDVEKNYEPGNCRWADSKQQGRNKRNNRIVEWRGELFTIADLSERTGVPYQRLHERIIRREWDVDKAVNEKPRGFW